MPTSIVRVELIDPPAGGVGCVGDRVAFVPDGAPVTVRSTAELKLAMEVMVMLGVAELPFRTVRLLGVAVRVKSGATGGMVTVRDIEVTRLSPPPEPVMVTV
jgi:hypothetical protein